MQKYLLAVILSFIVFNVAHGQSGADSTAVHSTQRDSTAKTPRKAIRKTKHLTKADSIKLKSDTSLKHLPKAGGKAKHLAKTDSSAARHLKADTAKTLHKGKGIVKHSHKADSIVTHPAKTDTLLKQAHKADTIVKRSPVSTLTYAQYDAYSKGDDINEFSRLAETNHYPMPGKVLKAAKQVGLTPLQTAKITELATNLERKKKEMGVFIIRNEGVLDSLFRNNKLNDGLIIFYTNRSGLYYGELRNAILQACFATQKILTPLQIRRYEATPQPR